MNPIQLSQSINLALQHHQNGRFAEAESVYRQVLKADPENFDGLHLLGVLALQTRRHDVAVDLIGKALRRNSFNPGAHNNLGTTFKEMGRLEEAEACYLRALQIKPDHADALNNLGIVLNDLGRLEEAEACYRRALVIKPDSADVHNNLGIALNNLGRREAAEVSYRRALKLRADFLEAHNNLGCILIDLGRLKEAEACLRKALELQPNNPKTYSNLGNTLKELGRLEEAEACYNRALEIQPGSLDCAINAHLMLPIISESSAAASSCLERYKAGLKTLKSLPDSFNDLSLNSNSLSFYLAYQNHNDRPIMEDLSQFLRERIPQLTAIAPHVRNWSPPQASARRIRVGFLSEFLAEHTIGKLYQGYISHLDRKNFEVVVIHTSKAKRDEFSQRLKGLADKYIELPVSLTAQQAAIAAEELDILFYPDIGMALSSYLLAFARLAPVQVVSWGHPDTTGLDTIDYFLSAASIEPEDAEEHYSERLIRLDRLPCYFQPLLAPTQLPPREALGLPEQGTLYGCPQSLFKIHPDFDAVLAAIAEGDPTGHIVLITGKHQTWTDLLRARWAKSYPALMERVLFLPRMPLEPFMSALAHMDVLLDPIHFGSGNTLYEAMVYGTPIVTWPGRFMRGRIVAGAYRQMGVAAPPIALSIDEYAPLALALGSDPARRRALSQESLEKAAGELFADLRAVQEFEAFLKASVCAAASGEKLPSCWQRSQSAQ